MQRTLTIKKEGGGGRDGKGKNKKAEKRIKDDIKINWRLTTVGLLIKEQNKNFNKKFHCIIKN